MSCLVSCQSVGFRKRIGFPLQGRGGVNPPQDWGLGNWLPLLHALEARGLGGFSPWSYPDAAAAGAAADAASAATVCISSCTYRMARSAPL